MPEVNFAGVGEPEEWTPAPAGEYILQLIDGEDTVTKGGKSPGTPMSKLKFEIVDCEGDLEKYNGRTIYHNAVFSKEALPVVKQMMKAFGVEIDEEKPMQWEWDELIGAKVQAVLKSVPARKDTKTGQEYSARNEVRRFIVSDEEE